MVHIAKQHKSMQKKVLKYFGMIICEMNSAT